MKKISRRRLLGLAAVLTRRLEAGHSVLRQTPRVSVEDFAHYPERITPSEDFFVRSHFEAPEIDAAWWELRVEGLVERPRVFRPEDLRPSRTLAVLLECAGNGVGAGGVSCARWGGLPLAELLEACGPKKGARFVRLTGADRGREPDADRDLSFARLLPLEVALRPATLIATTMNARPLDRDHGFPARAIVAGYYGADSVKWLQKVEVLAEPDEDFYMTRRFRRVRGGTPREPVGPVRVKSLIVRPRAGQLIRESTIEAGGFAWAGAEAIARVEARLDARAWEAATPMARSEPFSWTPWRHLFEHAGPGAHRIVARAFSASGPGQPEARDPAREDEYEQDHYHAVTCLVRP